MCKCKKLLVVAEELGRMTDEVKANQTDATIQEIMLAQAMYGVQLGIVNILKQITQAISIEAVDGDS